MKYAIVLILGSLPLAYLTACSVWSMFRPVEITASDETDVIPSDEDLQRIRDIEQLAHGRKQGLQDFAIQLQTMSESELLLPPPSSVSPVNTPQFAQIYDDWKKAQLAREFQRNYVASAIVEKKTTLAEITQSELDSRKKRLIEFKAKKNDYVQKLPATGGMFESVDRQLEVTEKALNTLALKGEIGGKRDLIMRQFMNKEFAKCQTDIGALRTFLREKGVGEDEIAGGAEISKLQERVEKCLQMQAIVEHRDKDAQHLAVSEFLKRNATLTEEPEASLYAGLTKLQKQLDHDRAVKKILEYDDIEVLLVQGAALLEQNPTDSDLRQKLRGHVLKRVEEVKGLGELRESQLSHLANCEEAVVELGPLFGQFTRNPNNISYWKYNPGALPQAQRVAKPAGDQQFSKNDFTTEPRSPTPIRVYQEYSRQRDILIQANSTKQQWVEFMLNCERWDRELQAFRRIWPPNEEPAKSVTLLEFSSEKQFAEKITNNWDAFSRIVKVTP